MHRFYLKIFPIIFFLVLLCAGPLSAQTIDRTIESPATENISFHPDNAEVKRTPDEEGETLGPDTPQAQAMSAVEVNGDEVEYDVQRNTLVAVGNVIIQKADVTLRCDKVVFHRDSKLAEAEGNVVLRSKSGEIRGEKLEFDFETMSGEFEGARIFADPYYGKAPVMTKTGENHIVMGEGAYLTTCDFDKPQYRLVSDKIDVYPGDKVVARNVKLLLGDVPVFYYPKYVQSLKDKTPRVVYTPGYDKSWGAFLLTQWRYYFSENFKGNIHVDYRERKDLAWGVDLDYKTPRTGKGIVRTYYMNERNITSDHPWEEKPSPTIERERYKIEWRHQWDVDEQTSTLMQYYKLSDATLLKDYFRNEYEEDSNPDTFFLLTRNMPQGTLSFRSDIRVNRFTSQVERLPEIQYNLANQRLGDTRLYWKSITTYSNLTEKTAAPSEARTNTMRLDAINELSHPFKVGFIELKPYVGGRSTYYSKTKNPSEYDVVRNQFVTGASLSSKVFRVFDVQIDTFGLDINRLRHIITPSVDYVFKTDPTIPSTKLDSFDPSIDELKGAHSITFELENKLQTKRDNNSVDLLRFILATDFLLKEHPASGGFDTIRSDIDFSPTDWLTLYADSVYNSQSEELTTANFDIYLKDNDKWTFSLGKRYSREVDDQITAGMEYKINPKWRVRSYERFDIDKGIQKEFEISLRRDLHSWDMEINFNETRGEGSEIWIVFTLKAFPEILVDFGTSFNKRKSGSQGNP